MTPNPWQVKHRRLTTPREDRTAVIEPPLDRAVDLLDGNLRIRDQLHCDLHGRSLADLSQLARTELLVAARRWTTAYRNVPTTPANSCGLLYLAGHQPQMFHPGVWFKNFALGELARQHGATAVNLIVDNDVLSDAAIRVPGGSVSEPHSVQIPFDRPDPRIPYEERHVEDRELLGAFGAHVIEQMAPLVADPLIAQYWPMVLSRAQETTNLGACLAQARHQLEDAWGLETLEVPHSYVCTGEAFQWFTAHLLARLPEFWVLHNEAVQWYRRAHRVRSLSHPVPELAEEDSWLEAPLWVWTAADPRRRRLWVRPAGDEMLLSDRQSWEARLPLHADGDAGRAAQRLLELQRGDVRIRSRALVTTLWARLALGDLFIHGIGGAKYDQVTDRLIERFFGLLPPSFMVVSATLLLPIERDRATPHDARVIQQRLRELTYHPERYLQDGLTQSYVAQPPSAVPPVSQPGAAVPPAELIAVKRRWIETPQTAQNARRRCHAIREANVALQPWIDPQRQILLQTQAQTLRKLQAKSVLASREWAFCLYPEPTLRGFMSGLLHKTT